MSTGLPSADYETDREQIAAIIANRAPELSTAPTAFAGEQAGALAQLTQGIGGDIDQAGRNFPPSSSASSSALDSAADAWGISNGAGGYGRRGATYAQGFTAYLTGYGGTTYLVGQQATGPGGVVLVLRSASPSLTISGTTTGQILGTWDADDTNLSSQGVVGNLLPGTQLTLVGPPGTSDSTIELLTGPAIPGQEAEQDAALLGRIQFKMQRPPNGGNGTDYVTWTENAKDASGNPVTTLTIIAYDYPNYHGDGLPLLVALQAGSGRGRQITAPLLSAILAYINGSTTREGQDPVGATASLLTGFMPDSRDLVCIARCVPSQDVYAFDWACGPVGYFLNGFTASSLPAWATSAGANFVVELLGLAPVSLKDAIDDVVKPAIQIDTRDILNAVTGPVVPEQSPCLAYLDATGRTSLAIRVANPGLFAAFVNIGNQVYPGGPIVSPVSANVLRTINNIGPSRISGLADPAQFWQDVVGVSTISTAAETTLADDGVSPIVARCIAGGVLIGIGDQPPVVQDVQASDNTINGPEVLYAGRIIITD